MANPAISELLSELESHARQQAKLTDINVPISKDDNMRLEALCEVFNIEKEALISSLLSTVLQEVEQTMPYQPGPKVIRVEDGEPIYEDIGLTPKYLAAKRKREKAAVKSLSAAAG